MAKEYTEQLANRVRGQGLQIDRLAQTVQRCGVTRFLLLAAFLIGAADLRSAPGIANLAADLCALATG